MQRYNIFLLIHKGLRAALYDTAWSLQLADFTNEDEAESALDKVKEIVMLFDGHAHKEDQYILPLINTYEPSLVACFEEEHEEDVRLGKELNAHIENYANSLTPLEKICAGRQLTDCFVKFLVFNLRHMGKEEDCLNEVLWRYYSDDELKSVSGKIAQSTPPWIQDFYAKWMLKGINNEEATLWMKAIKAGMPEIVFQTLYAKAQQELPKTRFNKIAASFTGSVQYA